MLIIVKSNLLILGIFYKKILNIEHGELKAKIGRTNTEDKIYTLLFLFL